ncbi:uncharacterized protein LOC142635550 [Castanea sativa]|uniref:uncharacterized protein LOC142635550 n=1 Tax=Castanea sativa TaxID=21020 RepID=UPI003F649BD3
MRVGQPRQMGSQILRKARGILSEFQLAHHCPLQHREAMDSRWVPPSPPWYKINVDAAVFNNSVGGGALIWDHDRSLVPAMSKHLPLPLGPLEAKGKAMDEAVSFAWDMRIRDVIFETDSQIVFDALSGTITPPIAIANLIVGIQHKLHSFRSTRFLHELRSGNKPAHTLAKYAKGINNFVTWIEKNPSIIESLMIQDAMYFSSP